MGLIIQSILINSVILVNIFRTPIFNIILELGYSIDLIIYPLIGFQLFLAYSSFEITGKKINSIPILFLIWSILTYLWRYTIPSKNCTISEAWAYCYPAGPLELNLPDIKNSLQMSGIFIVSSFIFLILGIIIYQRKTDKFSKVFSAIGIFMILNGVFNVVLSLINQTLFKAALWPFFALFYFIYIYGEIIKLEAT